MGLEQWISKSKEGFSFVTFKEAYARSPEDYSYPPDSETENDIIDICPPDLETVAYFRNHANLQGLAESFFPDEDINLENKELTKEHIQEILDVSLKNSMLSTEDGILWYEVSYENVIYTIDVMRECLGYIEEGYKIYYSCWY